MFKERITAAGEQRLNVGVGPDHGPPLWLLHGLGRRWRDFGPVLTELACRWAVRGLDHRGHGRSERAPGKYKVPDYVADLAAVLKRNRLPSVLVGHSLGALAALGAAAEAPLAVRAVVLLDPPSGPYLGRVDATPYAALWSGMRQLAGGGRPVAVTTRLLAELVIPGPAPGGMVRLGDVRDAAALRFLARCLHDLDPDVLLPPLSGTWLDGFDPVAVAARVRCPALLVVADGGRGGMLPPADADALAKALPDCTRVDLPGVGHLAHWEDPAAVLRPLHAFLASL